HLPHNDMDRLLKLREPFLPTPHRLQEVYLDLVPGLTSPDRFDIARYFQYYLAPLIYPPIQGNRFHFILLFICCLVNAITNDCKLVPLLIQLFTILYKVQFTYSQSTVTQGREKIPSLILS